MGLFIRTLVYFSGAIFFASGGRSFFFDLTIPHELCNRVPHSLAWKYRSRSVARRQWPDYPRPSNTPCQTTFTSVFSHGTQYRKKRDSQIKSISDRKYQQWQAKPVQTVSFSPQLQHRIPQQRTQR